ncbi:MAG: porin family protein [Mangrovibacterium sp.]
MKKKIVLLVCLLMVGIGSYAVLPVNIGIKAGYVTSELKASSFDNSATNQLMVGAWGRLNLGKKWHVQPELYYSKKGNEKFKFNSYNVPVLLGYRVIAKGPVKLRVNAGPVFTFVGKVSDAMESADIYKDSYTALQFGAGVDFLMLSLDLAMERGGNISDMSNLDANPAVFMVTLGWKIF